MDEPYCDSHTKHYDRSNTVYHIIPIPSMHFVVEQ